MLDSSTASARHLRVRFAGKATRLGLRCQRCMGRRPACRRRLPVNWRGRQLHRCSCAARGSPSRSGFTPSRVEEG
eukprot:4975460-Pyramimonas_sp.AAC.1